jgi:hypothetical protein
MRSLHRPRIAYPLAAQIRITFLHIFGRCIKQNLDAAPVRHVNKAAQAGRVHSRKLCAVKQPQHVVPIFHDLDQANAVIVQPIEFAFVVFVRVVGFA